MNVLLVEDDQIIASGLEYSLQMEGYTTYLCSDVASGKKALLENEIDLCLLDLTLPDGNGYELCKLAREKSDIPIIFLTACDEEVNVVMALDLGADDYITKPFRIRELMSRIKSILRRYHKENPSPNVLQIEDIRINTLEAKVFKKGQEIIMTALEYRLLLTFANNPGQVLTRNQLLEGIWDIGGDFVNDNTLTVYIKRIREKLEDNPQNPIVIKTVRGLGYKVGD